MNTPTNAPEPEREAFEAWYAPLLAGGCRANMPMRTNGEYVKAQAEIAWRAWQARAALATPPPPVQPEPNQQELVYLIFFDDYEVRPEIFAGAGATAAAYHRFKLISGQWNTHLFVKIKSNSRDDPFANANAALASSPAVQAVPEGWRDAIKQARLGLAAGSRSISNTDFEIEFGGALIDSIEERLAALSAPPVLQPCEWCSQTGIFTKDEHCKFCRGKGLVPVAASAPQAPAPEPIQTQDSGHQAERLIPDARTGQAGAAKALEFAEYMAKRAEQFIDAVDDAAMKRAALDGAPNDAHRPLVADRSEQADNDSIDALRALQSGIYEFRKRAAKATSVSENAQQSVLPDDVAGYLFTMRKLKKES